MRVRVRTDHRDEATIELSAGEAALIGRQPAPEQLGGASPKITQRVAIASPSVSANHVLVSRVEERVEILELGSRNGTWLELDPKAPASMPAPNEVRLHLAPATDQRIDGDEPADAVWPTAQEFGPAVIQAIQAWIDRRGLAVKIAVVPRRLSPHGEDTLGRMPLTPETDLVVDAIQTMDGTWLALLRRIEQYVRRQIAQWSAEEDLREAGLIIVSPAMKRAVRHVLDAAKRSAKALLLIGPSGSGKEGLARCYHLRGRPGGPFVSRNCAQFDFSKDLVLSQLFGADKGSFTGATRSLTGAIEAANGGTLLLDEVGELPVDVQSAMLRFLDHGEYTRLGSHAVHRSDVRIVGATNKDLRAACIAGEFRRDLWFRLAGEVVEVPPLTERFDDLVAYLQSRPWKHAGSLYEAIEPQALELLRNHRWEGNFRELVNFADRLPEDEKLDLETCRRALAVGSLHPVASAAVLDGPTSGDAWPTLHAQASAAFAADHAGTLPRTWDEVKTYVEAYLKPVLFAALSGAVAASRVEEIDLRAAADALRADRGTASKQLDRYFVRFSSEPR